MTSNFGDSPELAEFRDRVRQWLRDNGHAAPARRLFPPQDESAVKPWRSWQSLLANAGLAAPTWPREHGGLDLAPSGQLVVAQELERADLPGVFDFIGVEMIGPTLLAHGTSDQQHRHLRPLLAGDEVWCQLFSEPGGGSDLAGLRTRAVQQPDGRWRITGQKVWTTHAQYATFGLLAARTGTLESRHRGLTLFVVPMAAPGVSVRPIRQISGEPEFNEVFLDEVDLDAGHVVGEVDGGWSVAMSMLGFERLSVASGHHTASLDQLVTTLTEHRDTCDAAERTRLGHVAAELLAVRHFTHRLLRGLQPGALPGPEAGLAKITAVKVSFDACTLAVDVLGPSGLSGDWGRQISGFPGVRSAGGSEEILRNVVGERVLGLPPEPRPHSTTSSSPENRTARATDSGLDTDLPEEHRALVDATRQALSRLRPLDDARAALDGGPAPSAWQLAGPAGWAGLLLGEEVDGAAAGAREAMLVMRECGRALAAPHLVGHLPATKLLELAQADAALRTDLAGGTRRAVYVEAADEVTISTGNSGPRLTGRIAHAVDAVGADVVVVGATAGVAWCLANSDGITVEPLDSYDPTRGLAAITFDDVSVHVLEIPLDGRRQAVQLQQALLGAEALGAAEHCLESSRWYAVDRTAFGRPIGSYQAIKHALVEMLRQVENVRSLADYAGWAWTHRPTDFALTAHALRAAADQTLHHTARQAIFIHGALGVTWEHDAPLYYRRAELTRRLSGGTDAAARAVAEILLRDPASYSRAHR